MTVLERKRKDGGSRAKIRFKAQDKPSEAQVADAAAPSAQKHSFMLLFCIVEYGKEHIITDILDEFKINFNMTCHAKGTANSVLMEILGLQDSKKMVVLSIIEQYKIQTVLETIRSSYNNAGAVFTVRLDSIGGINTLKFLKGEKDGSECI